MEEHVQDELEYLEAKLEVARDIIYSMIHDHDEIEEKIRRIKEEAGAA